MTKADVVSEISERTGIEKKEVMEVVENFFTVLKDSMIDGNDVFFRGFGSFVVKKRAKKVARNIAKNTSMIIAPHYIPSFKPSKSFVEKVKASVKAR